MNTQTGERITYKQLMELPLEERRKYVEVSRDLTAIIRATNQIKLYRPCWCGSGEKLKFCQKKNHENRKLRNESEHNGQEQVQGAQETVG